MSMVDAAPQRLPMDPERARFLFGEIVRLQKENKAQDTLAFCEELAAMGLEAPGLLHLHAWAERANRNLIGARKLLERALAINPREAGAIAAYGIVLFEIGLIEHSVIILKKALEVDPFNIDAWCNLGRSQLAVGDGIDAEKSLRRALALDPTRIPAILDLTKVMMLRRRYDLALQYLDEVTRQIGFNDEVFLYRLEIHYLGGDLHGLAEIIATAPRDELGDRHFARMRQFSIASAHARGDYEEALALLRESQFEGTEFDYDWYELHGLVHFSLGLHEEGIKGLETAIAMSPERHGAKMQLGMFKIMTGKIVEGHELYENRWLTTGFPSNRRAFDAARWQGEPLEGRALLVWGEQGIGDEVRCSSLFSDLKDFGGPVTIECTKKLVPLFSSAFPWAEVRANGPNECRQDPAYQHYAYQIPFESLAPILRPTVADFDARQKPWLIRDMKREARFRTRLNLGPEDIVVGLCWRSRNMEPKRLQYFLRAEDLVPLGQLKNVVFLNLQYSGSDEEVARLHRLGFRIRHFEDINQKDDLVSAAAMIGLCDLVMGVGTSVIDLACGLGRPAITFHRSMEMNQMGVPGRYPWYPTMKLHTFPKSGNADVIPEMIAQWDETIRWAQQIDAQYQAPRV